MCLFPRAVGFELIFAYLSSCSLSMVFSCSLFPPLSSEGKKSRLCSLTRKQQPSMLFWVPSRISTTLRNLASACMDVRLGLATEHVVLRFMEPT